MSHQELYELLYPNGYVDHATGQNTDKVWLYLRWSLLVACVGMIVLTNTFLFTKLQPTV